MYKVIATISGTIKCNNTKNILCISSQKNNISKKKKKWVEAISVDNSNDVF